MIWNRSFHTLIPRNPIINRELRRQRQTTSTLRGFIESVGVVAIAIGCSAVMFISIAQESNAGVEWLYHRDPIELLAWIFHAAAVLRMLAAGVFAISPDAFLLASDDLMVTPISNWRLLSGKWWSALHQVRGWMLALGILQLGVVFSIALEQLTQIAWSKSCGMPCVVYIGGLHKHEWLTPARLTFVVSAAVGLAILETLSCTALGMAAAIVGRTKYGLISAISLRFAPILIFAYFPRYDLGANLYGRYRLYTWFNFADFGTGAIIQIINPINIWGSSSDRGVLGLCAVAGMLLFFMGASLTTAWLVMRRTRR